MNFSAKIDIGSGGLSDSPPAKMFNVVIDPGHGGADPGAVGRVYKLRERDVVMQIARFMSELGQQGRVGIHLTRRNNETRRTINERTTFPATPKIDAFISLHCNAFNDPRVHGSEVFHWQGNIKGRTLSQFILSDIIRETEWFSRGVKETTGFGVLRRTARIPSCLVEYNFISNHKIEEQFQSIDLLYNLATCTYTAIDRYLGQ
jgi:N-acetylmuramoyl-L-alanine amidase